MRFEGSFTVYFGSHRHFPIFSSTATKVAWLFTCRRPSDSSPILSGLPLDHHPTRGSPPFQCWLLPGIPTARWLVVWPSTLDQLEPMGLSSLLNDPIDMAITDPSLATRRSHPGLNGGRHCPNSSTVHCILSSSSSSRQRSIRSFLHSASDGRIAVASRTWVTLSYSRFWVHLSQICVFRYQSSV